jgi:hypothetical protein
MGTSHWLMASDPQIRMSLDILQNIQGFTHVDTKPDGSRDGPELPHMLFNLGPTSESGPLADQYAEVIIRLMWLTGWIDHNDPKIPHNTDKLLWIISVSAPRGHQLVWDTLSRHL